MITMNLVDALVFVTVIGSGLMAGTFFVFSIAVMKALARISPQAGIAAMQAINVVIVNPIFLAVFLGTAVACALVLALGLAGQEVPGGLLTVLGSLLYIIGSFLVTALFNVPMNDALASVTPTGAESERHWNRYTVRWTAWNHVRTAACIGTMTLNMLGLVR